MKYIKQITIILTISFVGDVLNRCIPLPVPSGVYGMLILFLLLCTKALKLEQVKETGNFLIEIMPITFIPPGVGLMASWGIIEPILVPVVTITVASTLADMLAASGVTKLVLRMKKGGI